MLFSFVEIILCFHIILWVTISCDPLLQKGLCLNQEGSTLTILLCSKKVNGFFFQGKSPGLSVQIRTGASSSSNNTMKNEVFEGIGDDDL